MHLLCALQPHSDALAHVGVYLIEFALDPSQHCALTSQDAPHPLELARMRIPTCLAAQGRALPRVALSQSNAVALGQQHQLLACHLKQTAVGRIRDRLFWKTTSPIRIFQPPFADCFI